MELIKTNFKTDMLLTDGTLCTYIRECKSDVFNWRIYNLRLCVTRRVSYFQMREDQSVLFKIYTVGRFTTVQNKKKNPTCTQQVLINLTLEPTEKYK